MKEKGILRRIETPYFDGFSLCGMTTYNAHLGLLDAQLLGYHLDKLLVCRTLNRGCGELYLNRPVIHDP